MNAQGRIAFLDGLRGIAILAVLLFHVYSRHDDRLNFVQITRDIPIFQYGFFGVQLFFMISGFVIFMTLDRNTHYLTFLYKRWIRLFPALLIVSLFIFFTSTYFYERPSGEPDFIDLLASLLFIDFRFINLYTNWQAKPLEGSFWSLYVEVIFYIFSGFIYYFCGRRKLINLMFSIYLVSFFSLILVVFYPENIFINSLLIFFKLAGFMHYGWFIIGMIIYEKMTNSVFHMFKFLVIIILIVFTYAGVSVVHPIAALVTIALFLTPFINKKAQNLVSIRPLLFLGSVSYPFYLLHENLIISMIIKIVNYVEFNDYLQILTPIIPSLIVLLLSWLIVNFIEVKIKNVLILAIEVLMYLFRLFKNKIMIFNYNK